MQGPVGCKYLTGDVCWGFGQSVHGGQPGDVPAHVQCFHAFPAGFAVKENGKENPLQDASLGTFPPSRFLSSCSVVAQGGSAHAEAAAEDGSWLGWALFPRAVRWGLTGIRDADANPASGISPGISGVTRWDV